jgi:hypothetical protein
MGHPAMLGEAFCPNLPAWYKADLTNSLGLPEVMIHCSLHSFQGPFQQTAGAAKI